MLIVSNNKIIDFNITGYQFPNHRPSSDDFDYDANWLICEIKYSEDDLNEEYSDPCLLTYELQELTESMQKILNCEEDAYISEFMEPYLKISIVRCEEKLVFTMQFVYDTTDRNWNTRKISSIMNEEVAIQMLNELTKLQNAFPVR